MTRTQKLFVAAAALLLVTATKLAYSGKPGESVARVTRGDVVVDVVAPAIVEAKADPVALAFETAGRIVEIEVAEGDRVSAGQLVARLDDRLARAQVARAQAAVDRARAARDLAFAGARPAEIAAIEADARAAAAQAADRSLTRERTAKLAADGAVSRAEADTAAHGAQAADAFAAAAAARADVVRQGERREVRRETVAGVAAAEAELELAKTLLSQTELRAPRDGVVLRRTMEVGEQVVTTPPKVVLTVADVDDLQLRVEIDENDVGRVQIGQHAFATADAYGALRFDGHVVRRASELGRKHLRLEDPHAKTDTRVLEVTVDLDQPADLPLGLRMDTHVRTVLAHDVLVVPKRALARGTGPGRVDVLVDGKRTERVVELGADDGDVVEVRRGLDEGDAVALP